MKVSVLALTALAGFAAAAPVSESREVDTDGIFNPAVWGIKRDGKDADRGFGEVNWKRDGKAADRGFGEVNWKRDEKDADRGFGEVNWKRDPADTDKAYFPSTWSNDREAN